MTDPNDPRPQAVIRTTAADNSTEPRGAYVDQGLTRRNLRTQASDAVDPTDLAKGVKGGGTEVYEVAGTDHRPSNAPSAVPNSPNSWKNGRDYYKNGGMTGQDFFNNG